MGPAHSPDAPAPQHVFVPSCDPKAVSMLLAMKTSREAISRAA